MGEVIWVEILSHHHREVMSRQRVDKSEIRIGRGYDNDVIIDDPYVAAQHLLIRPDDTGSLVAEDLGSANGTFVARSRRRLQRFRINPDRVIRIGQTHLRIRHGNHPVPGERYLPSRVPSWPVTAALGVAMLAVLLVSQWLQERSEPQLHRYVETAILWIGITIGWTAVWGMICRVFSRRARFERNLKITLSGLLIYFLFKEILQLGAYSLAITELQTYQFAGMVILLAIICLLHLRTIGQSLMWLKGGVLAALVVVVLAAQALTQSEVRLGNNQQDYVRRMMPPSLRFVPLRTEDRFFQNAENLRPNLDADRKKELPIGGGVLFGND